MSKQSTRKLNSRLQETPIAVVGMASVFADAKNLQSYWDNILNKIDCIMDVPENRWKIDEYYSANKSDADKTYCKRGGFIPDLDFNPMEFGLPPNILEVTDVAQLLSLVIAKDVLEDAGVADGSGYDRKKIGITLGVGGGQKLLTSLVSRLQYPVLDKVLKSSGVNESDSAAIIEKFKKAYVGWEENSFPGMLGNVIAGRIANRFDFGGMNCVVDAACAGSLAAMKMAVSELLEGRSEMMITGGVCCDNSIMMYMSFSKTPAFTDAESVETFDENSRGMMVGEGLGMVALKRLEDAERDGDRIYSVIKGIGASSDGKFKSIYAPRPEGQAKALQQAYEDAGFEPQTVGLIEAHGTGTAAGDVAEFGGLKYGFDDGRAEKQYIALGSVKSQVGHTKAAAGTAGFIKACLALHHKVLPATINVKTPNPKMDIENSPFYINATTRPWLPRADGAPRRAGVSAFGFGGTNFHFVLEEYRPVQESHFRVQTVASPCLIAADSQAALLAECQNRLALLKGDEAEKAQYALVQGSPIRKLAANQPRLGFVTKNAEESIKALDSAIKTFAAKAADDSWSLPSGVYYRSSGVDAGEKVVALFSGQGSQYVDMGSELTINYPPMMDTVAQLDALFAEDGVRLSDKIYPKAAFTKEAADAQITELQKTQYAQPAIGAISAGLYKLLGNTGFKPDFVAGHSFGELTALWAAGVITEADYYSLAKARGAAMAAPEDTSFDAGTMIAVVGDVSKVADEIKAIPEVSIANFNANNQVVVAGATEQVRKAQAELKAKGFKVVALPVSAAFHTPLVGHAQKPFAAAIQNAKFNKPEVPVYSNASGEQYPESPAEIKKILKRHILESVQFKNELDNLYAAGGRIFVEFGPKNVLTKLVENVLSGKPHVAVALNANAKGSADLSLRQAVVQLAVAGVSLEGFDPYEIEREDISQKKKSPLTISLGGQHYMSDKTLKAYDDALNDGHVIEGKVEVVEKVVEKIVEKIVEKEVIKEVPVAMANTAVHGVSTDTASQPMRNMPAMHQPEVIAANESGPSTSGSVLDNSIEMFFAQQNDTLAVHEKYLESPRQYTDTFSKLMEQQLALVSQGHQIPDSVERSMMMFHQHQGDTLKAHEHYLNNQSDNVSAALNLLKQQYGSATATLQVSVPQAQLASRAVTASATPVAANSAAPLSSPMSSAQSSPHSSTQPTPQVVAPTPASAVVQPAKQPAPIVSAAKVAPVAVKVAPTPVPAPVQQAAPALSLEKINSVMLSVVGEKTGYPAEMLELEMDMEADLGIDSIKRVEILGAVQDELPELPELPASDLAELRTLGEIVEYMKNAVGDGPVATIAVAPEAANASAPVVNSAPALDLQKIQQVMLAVVGEKTGYPVEMLELEMDMEADLGIDSIKRVEILGAVQDELPELPELAASDLAELRTLGEIVDYMKAQVAVSASAPVTAVPNAAPTASAPALDLEKINRVMLAVVGEKTGYPVEMLELEMDMEADLGIDSIKRVEILGAVQDELPELPELAASELAELRTLGEIVDYMKAQVALVAPVATAPIASATAPITNTPTLDLEKINSVMMLVVAEKTGYPVEMLELEMDMEADLGIDSIKRVEILGAVQDQLPELPELAAGELAELRTLGEIVSYMKSAVSVVSEAAPVVTPAAPASETSVSAPAVDLNAIQQVMLAVVGEKIGYPVEMLELEMDMEADLGIDSIKRVEILGAVQDQLPNLPELVASDLAELRTLAEIVDYMKSKAGAASGSAPSGASVQPIVAAETATQAPSSKGVVKNLPQPDLLALDLPTQNVCVVTDEGTTVTAKLCKALADKGWQVALVRFPASIIKSPAKVSAATKSFDMKDMSEAALQQVLKSIETSLGAIGACIQLLSKTDSTATGIDYPQVSQSILLNSFLMAKHLKASLNKAGENGRALFVTVPRLDGVLGYGDATGADLVQGGLFGLTKTVGLEWPNVFCRAIDIAPSVKADQAVAYIMAEIYDSNTALSEVGYSANGRVTLETETLDSYSVAQGNAITKNSVFLVSGGAKGVTAKCIEALAARYKSKFIVLGRSEFDSEEPVWAHNCFDEPELKKLAMQELSAQGIKPTPVKVKELLQPVLSAREIQSTLNAISKAGGIARYISADVTNGAAMAERIAPAVAELGAITGIIHGAGVLADKFIEQKTVADFESVYSTKVQGMQAMLSCVEAAKLQQLILFSSAAGFYGNTGQADYSVANEILNKTALRFKQLHPSCQVISFNWGPWDGGMVTPELKRMFAERNVFVIPVAAGAELFANEVAAANNHATQIMVGNDMRDGGTTAGSQAVKKPLAHSL